MSTSPELSPPNGIASSPRGDIVAVQTNGHPDESDLSDIQAAAEVVVSPRPASPSGYRDADADADADIADEDEDSESVNNDASDDADFDMADSPASVQSIQEDDDVEEAASSSESQRAPKRKAPAVVLEDDYMRENPELYGLRRSVGPAVKSRVLQSSCRLIDVLADTSDPTSQSCKLDLLAFTCRVC